MKDPDTSDSYDEDCNLSDEVSDDDLNNTSDNNTGSDSEEEDVVIKAIKEENNKARSNPPSIILDDLITDISFHPVKNLIALANVVGDVLLFEYHYDENKLLRTFELHLKSCRDVEFDDGGTSMYSTSKDKVLLCTDIESGKLKNCYENCHDEPVYKMLCLGNNKVVTGDDGGTVKLWDMRKQEPVFSLKLGDDYISDMVTNETEKYLVCSSGEGVITSIDLKARKVNVKSEEYDCEMTCMGLFRSETKLLVGTSIGKFYLFNWKEFGYHSDEYTGQKHSVACMIPITQNIVVTSGEDGILRASHMFPQRQLGVVGQHDMPVECLDISHDGGFVASCSLNNDVKFWNISYFESIDNIIDVTKKQNKRRDMSKNLPSSSIKNASDFFSGLL